ncbi:hypothetical protein [Streptococcus sp. NLN64]|uniref:hypothetical protein n=1 Tax=Streptococcus sp. NLN64 TaxID=2822799 RepID=UPI0018CB7B3A|nr:hypothetical protein [Streptococcus sp. NLN64]MBG9366526.1 hypothetical protein [Streptococcus sp. NLN64]
MSKYRVKHFTRELPAELDRDVNDFIDENDIEVFKYTLTPIGIGATGGFVGVLEYEVEE